MKTVTITNRITLSLAAMLVLANITGDESGHWLPHTSPQPEDATIYCTGLNELRQAALITPGDGVYLFTPWGETLIDQMTQDTSPRAALPGIGPMRDLADMITAKEPGVGFALVAFTFGSGPRQANYIGNAPRADMLYALEGLVNKWKAEGPEVPGVDDGQ